MALRDAFESTPNDDPIYGKALRGMTGLLTQDRGVRLARKRGVRGAIAGLAEADLRSLERDPGRLPGGSFIHSFLQKVAGLDDKDIQEIGRVTPTQETIDVTDPRVEPVRDLTTVEHGIRMMRRLSASLGSSFRTAVPTFAGIEMAVNEGELAPATTNEEKLVDFIAVTLAGLGVTAPLALGLGPALAPAVAGSAAGRLLTGSIPQALGRAATPGSLAARAAAGGVPAEKVTELVGSTLADVGLGAGFAAAEAVAAEQLPGVDLSPGQTAALVGLGGFGGAGIGLFLRRGTVLNIAKASSLTNATPVEDLIITPGTVVGGRRAVMTKRNQLVWRWADEAAAKEAGAEVGNFAPNPLVGMKPEEAAAIRGKFFDDAKAAFEATKPGQAAAAQAAGASRTTLPPGLEHRARDVNYLAAQYDRYAAARVKYLPREALESELNETRRLLVDPSIPENERVSAMAKIIATEQQLGIGGVTPTGALPYEVELAAHEHATTMRRLYGSDAAREDARVLMALDKPVLGQRVLEILDQNVPEAQFKAVKDRLGKVERQMNRGLTRGSRVISDGEVYMLAQRPRFGYAKALKLHGGKELHTIDVGAAQMLPEAGSTVKMSNGKIVRVLYLEPDGVTFAGVSAERKPKRGTYVLGDIVESGEGATRSQAAQAQQSMDPDASDLAEVPPTQALTSAGEEVTLTDVGRESARVRTADGRTKTIPRNKVRAGSRGPSAELVTDFSPNTLPQADNRILYFVASEANAPALEQAHQAGQDIGKYVAGNVHVLPPVPATPGVALYAVELPRKLVPRKLYSPEANRAVQALSGEQKVDSYLSQIALSKDQLKGQRLYRVPRSLWASAQRPEAHLRDMRVSVQQAYLRRLLSFDEAVNTEVAEASRQAADARVAQQTAMEQGHGPALSQARAAEADAIVQAHEEITELTVPATEQLQRALDDFRERDPARVKRALFEEQGLVPETADLWVETLNELPPQDLSPGEALVAFSRTNAGERAYIVKSRQPTVERDARGGVEPSTRDVWRVEVVSPNGHTVRELSDVFDSVDKVTQYLVDANFIPTLARITRARFVHSRFPRVVADVRQAPNQKGVTLSVFEEALERESRARVYMEHSKMPFPDEFSAQQWLRSNLFRDARNIIGLSGSGTPVNALGAEPFISKWFAALPRATELKSIKKAQLYSAENMLSNLMKALQRTYRWIPEAVQEYANEFYTIYQRRIGQAPFDSDTRIVLGRPTPDDLGPQIARAPSDFADPSMTVAELTGDVDVGDMILGYEPTLINIEHKPIVRVSRIRPVSQPEGTQVVPSTTPRLEARRALGETSPAPGRRTPEEEGRALAQRLAQQADVEAALQAREPVPGQELPVDITMLPLERPDVLRVYAGMEVHRGKAKSPKARAARDAEKRYITQSEWTPAVVKSTLDPTPPGAVEPVEYGRVGRYGPTGQPVRIIEASPAGNEVLVEFPDKAQRMVAKADVTQGKTRRDDVTDYLIAGHVADGYYHMFTGRILPLGYGPVEANLGLLGATDFPVVRDAMLARWRELIPQMQPKKTSGAATTVVMPAEVAGEVLGLFSRAQELYRTTGKGKAPAKIVGREPPPELAARVARLERREQEILEDIRLEKGISPRAKKPVQALQDDLKNTREQLSAARAELPDPAAPPPVVGRETETVADLLLNELPAGLRRPFKQAVYLDTRRAMGDSPYAKIIAQAKAGLIGEKPAARLREWGKQYNLSENLPLQYVVQELVHRGVINQNAAHFMVRLRNEGGFFGAASSILDEPIQRVDVSNPHISDIGDVPSSVDPRIPHKMLRRHPTTRMVYDAVRRAHERQMRGLRDGAMFIKELEEMGYSSDDRVALRQLLKTHDTWKQAKKAGAEARLQRGFERYREQFELHRKQIIAHLLRRGIEPVRLTAEMLKDPRVVTWLAERGIDGDNAIEGAMISVRDVGTYDRVPPGFPKQFRGEQRSNWSPDEISEFTRLLDEYDNPGDLPAGLDAARRQKYANVFDFFKHFRRNNYWPLVHEGTIAVLVERGGKEQVAGWAPSFFDAWQTWKALVQEGRIGAGENVRIKQTRWQADDIMARATASPREMRQVMEAMEQYVNFSPDELKAVLVREGQLVPPQGKPPTVAHAFERKANLEPVLGDPDREYYLYNARIQRAAYRHEVNQALKLLWDQDLDKALSGGHGTPRLFGEGGLVNLRKYAEDFIARALGQPTAGERAAARVFDILNFIKTAPSLLLEKMKGNDVPAEVWREINLSRARARASDLIAAQSLWRLGGNMTSALVNMTQFFTNTVPLLVDDQTSALAAELLALEAYKDAGRLWAAKTGRQLKRIAGRPVQPPKIPDDLVEAHAVAEAVGVRLMPGKDIAGISGASWADFVDAPVFPHAVKDVPEFGLDLARWAAMAAFNGAEEMNRLGTVIALYRKLKPRGVSLEEITERARLLLREAQFSYNDIDLPMMFTYAGPLGRVFFQFKTFLVNQLSFEKDLFTRAFVQRDANAVTQLTSHLAHQWMFGGVRGTLSNPMISVPVTLLGLFKGIDGVQWLLNNGFGGRPLDEDTFMAQLQEERARRQDPVEQMQGKIAYRADDILWHGLPALVHLSLGQRVGVSGQELAFLPRYPEIFGPHFSVYGDLASVWARYLSSDLPHGRAALGAAAGAVAASVPLGRRGLSIAERAARGGIPFATAIPAVAGSVLATRNTGVGSFGDFLTDTEEGRTLIARGLPSIARNLTRTIEIFNEQALYDLDGKPHHLPASDVTEEAVWAMLGAPTIRREEHYAASGFLLKGSATIEENTRRLFVERIARAMRDDDGETELELRAQALEMGIEIDEQTIERELETLTQDALESIRQRLPVRERLRSPGESR